MLFRSLYAFEQMSSYDLIRNFMGTFFREKGNASLRGGAFKKASWITTLRIYANKLRGVAEVLFFPIDKILHMCGLRYISQLVIAEKK